MADAQAPDISISSRRFFIAIFIAIFAGASGAYSQVETRRENGVFAIDPPTPYTHYTPSGRARGRLLAVHGLDSSKEIMNVFSLAMADAGFEVYAIDLPGHGDSEIPFDGLAARSAVNAVLDNLGSDIKVVGHSFGAALLLDLANERDFNDMILISPPPTPVGSIRAQRVLALAGEFDIPRIKAFVPELQTAGGEGIVETRSVRWAGHSGAMFVPSTQRDITTWLGGDVSNIHTKWRLGLLGSMIVSGVLLGIALLASPSNGVAVSGSDEKGGSAIFRYATAGAMAMLVYAAVPTAFSWLRLFATDYVIGFVFFAGLALLAMRGQRIMGIRSALGIPCAIAILAAAYVIILPGVWAGGNTLHLAPHEARWWRLPLIALAVLPLLIADEIYIRPIRPWWKAATLAFATRMVLAGFLLTGALTFNRSAGFLVVIIHLIVFFWMLLWLLGESINRGTRNSFATALFGAIIQAWLFASVFVTK